MTTFDKREQAFEAEFVHGEDIRFRAVARSNKLLGNWAAATLGLTGEAATAYSNALVVAELEHKSGEDTLHKVSRDLASKGISQHEEAPKCKNSSGPRESDDGSVTPKCPITKTRTIPHEDY